MLDGIFNPAFLQAAGRAGKGDGITLFTTAADPTLASVSCEQMSVISIKNGEKHIDTYENLSGAALSISADANTKFIIAGKLTGAWEIASSDITSIAIKHTSITSLDCSNCSALQELNLSTNTALTSLNCSYCQALQELNLSTNTALESLDCNSCSALQELNLSTNTALESLDCGDCSALQELNLSTNTALTSLNCSYCVKVESISTLCNNSTVATAIAGIISNADENAGVVKTNSDGDYYSTIETAATAKGWTIAPLPA